MLLISAVIVARDVRNVAADPYEEDKDIQKKRPCTLLGSKRVPSVCIRGTSDGMEPR